MKFLYSIVLLLLISCNSVLHKSYTSEGIDAPFGDITFQKKFKAKRELRKLPLNQVVYYGKTFLEPLYSYAVLLDPDTSKLDTSAFGFSRSKDVNGHRVYVVGWSDDRLPKSDIERIFDSTSVVAPIEPTE